MPDEPLSRSKPLRAYWGASVRFCKSSDGVAEQSRERTRRLAASRRSAREQARLEYGMSLGSCQIITLVRGFNLDLAFRRDAWYLLRTRLQQRWPDAQAWTCLEYGKQRGIHLHIVVRGVPELTKKWLAHVVSLLPPDGNGQVVEVGDIQPVTDAEDLASYLTKQLRDPHYWDGLPRSFHPVSATHFWSPGWKESSAAGAHVGKQKRV